MKGNAFSLSLTIIFFPFLAACVPYAVVGGKYTASTENFIVDLPQGWRRHDLSADADRVARAVVEELQKRRKLDWDTVRITRDSLLLQQISIGRVSVNDELPHTKKKLSQGMLPQEAAEVLTDSIRANPNLIRQEIMENIPATVGGKPGFKLHYTYSTKEELKIEGLLYGALADQWLYYVLYEAPAQHYFKKDLQVFEGTRGSFQISAGRG